MQLLYHVNLGAPVLGNGATLQAALCEIAPKDDLSASEIEQWNQYGSPESGYAERVYFAKPCSDEANESVAMLRSAEGNRGLAVIYNVKGLPRFILWKNTGAQQDGYVTGLEPATNYPNTRSFEEKQGRVVEIAPDETASFRVSLNPLTNAESVNAVSERITSIQGDVSPKIHATPRPGWSPGA